jgi:predicted ester cyclase
VSAASTDTDANKAVVRAFVEAWNARDLARFDDLMSEACRLTVGAETLSCSPAATRAIAEHWLAGFPDYQFELLDLIAEGDKVVARMPFTGTQSGPVLDLPPSGRPVRVSEIVIFRVVDGKIVEAWEEYDELGLRRQVGALSAPILTPETMPPGMPPSE